MATLSCMCGFKVEDADHYVVEGTMWHHAMAEHKDQIAGMAADQMTDWLRKADQEMGVK